MPTITSKSGSSLEQDRALERQLLEALEVVGPEPTRFNRVLETVEEKHGRPNDTAIRAALWRLLYRGVVELTPDLMLKAA